MGAKDLIFFQMQEPALRLLENQIGEFLKCLTRNQLALREVKVIADQPSFIMQASLKTFTLRSPRPPVDFGKQTTSQLTMLLLFFSELEDHKKFFSRQSI